MVVNLSERWGRLQTWFAITEKRKLFERTIEWLLALAGPIVAYNAVFNRYGWKSDYYSKWSESWFALVLLVAMVGPAIVRLFSGDGMALHKRFTLAAIMALGVAAGLKFRPYFGGATLMGFFVPMGLYAVAAYLWFQWRSSKSLREKRPSERAVASRGETAQSKSS